VVKVRKSIVIDAPVTDVWRVLRDFNGHDRWHPAVSDSVVEDGVAADVVGAVRRFRLTDGSELCEQLLALSDRDWRLTYCLLEAPVPLMGYTAMIRLRPVTDRNATYWEWSSEFHPPEQRRDELVRLVAEEIYAAGFAAIRQLFQQGGAPAGAYRSGAVAAPPPAADAGLDAPVSAAGAAAAPTRAIVVAHHGGPEVLQLREVVLPPLNWGEVRIAQRLVGVNFIDVLCRNGTFDLLVPPGVPGMEAVGAVEALGPGVTGLAIGQRVAYACPPLGAYCERRNMPAELLVPLPDDISDETAAAGLLKGTTASFLVGDVHPLRRGEVALIHAAAGGVGQILLQWVRHLGATAIAVVSRDDKARVIAPYGADAVIVTAREDLADEVQRLTAGKGADVAFDAVGSDTFAASLAALASPGHLVSYGEASGPIGSTDIGRLASKSVTLSRPNYRHFTDTAEKRARHAERFFGLVRAGVIRVAPPRRYRLAEAAQAHRDLESRQSVGSLVLGVAER
jgi:NADPH:quinone reductase-like Zn-dependent oxidoreductase